VSHASTQPAVKVTAMRKHSLAAAVLAALSLEAVCAASVALGGKLTRQADK